MKTLRKYVYLKHDNIEQIFEVFVHGEADQRKLAVVA